MSDKLKKNIRLIYGITLSAFLIITGVLLISSCISIYNLGDRPFTAENISAAFARIQIPVYITLIAIVGGIILQLLFPQQNGKIRSTPDKKKLADRLRKRVDFSACTPEIASAIAKEKRTRTLTRIICAVYCLIAIIPALIYTLNSENYSLESYNESVISACTYVLTCSFVALGGLVACSYIENASYDTEIDLLRSAIISGAKNAHVATDDDTNQSKFHPVLIGARVVILIAAIFFIIEGISNGGMSDVLIKAINICTECIGLG